MLGSWVRVPAGSQKGSQLANLFYFIVFQTAFDMRIAIAGAHKVGKASLAEALLENLPGYRRFY
jgi:hypothetical protein